MLKNCALDGGLVKNEPEEFGCDLMLVHRKIFVAEEIHWDAFGQLIAHVAVISLKLWERRTDPRIEGFRELFIDRLSCFHAVAAGVHQEEE